MKIATMLALGVLAGLTGLACGGGASANEGANEGSSASALSATCFGTRPPSDQCKTSFCDSTTQDWEYHYAASGTTCQTSGKCDGQGTCVFSAPPPPPPTAVTNTRVTGADWTTMTLAWDYDSSAAGYRVVSTIGLHTITLPPLSTTWTYAGLTSGTQYCFHVDAYNQTGTATGPTVCGVTHFTERVGLRSWGTSTGPLDLVPMQGSTAEYLTPLFIDSLVFAAADNISPYGLIGFKLVPGTATFYDCYGSNSTAPSAWLPVGGTIGQTELFNLYGTWPVPLPDTVSGLPGTEPIYDLGFFACPVYANQPLNYAPTDSSIITVRYTQ